MPPRVDHRGRCQDGLHHPRITVGERLCRELQRSSAGRTPEWRDLLHSEGGTDRDRELETTLQHRPPPRVARIPPTRPGGVHASLHRLAGCARPSGSADQATYGGAAYRTLALISDHLVGGRSSRRIRRWRFHGRPVIRTPSPSTWRSPGAPVRRRGGGSFRASARPRCGKGRSSARRGTPAIPDVLGGSHGPRHRSQDRLDENASRPMR